jgi:hypothetical protein
MGPGVRRDDVLDSLRPELVQHIRKHNFAAASFALSGSAASGL